MEQTTQITTLAELELFAEQFLHALEGRASSTATVVALSGDLGAGKTTFVQLLAKKLGVTDVVTSPTFTIMKGYEIVNDSFGRLVHMDAYRIETIDEVRPLRLEEIFTAPKTLFCIEWAEKISVVLPKDAIFIDIKTVKEVREISVKGLTF